MRLMAKHDVLRIVADVSMEELHRRVLSHPEMLRALRLVLADPAMLHLSSETARAVVDAIGAAEGRS